jgi:hypothetical protein
MLPGLTEISQLSAAHIGKYRRKLANGILLGVPVTGGVL